MGSKICMNEMCRVTATQECKKGWGLKSGGFATLCYSCGSAYENQVFCETFHLEESGWRECKLCGKRIHCGCIASKYLHNYLDYGGVGCLSCTRVLDAQLMRPIQTPNSDIPNGFGTMGAVGERQSSVLENGVDSNGVDKGKHMQLSKSMDGSRYFPQSQKGDINSSLRQSKEVGMNPFREVGMGFPNITPQSVGSSVFTNTDNNKPAVGLKDMYDSLAQPSLSFSLGTPLRPPTSVLPIPGGIVEGREQNKVPPFQQGQRTRHILPKPPKNGLGMGSDVNKTAVPPIRVARPPAEGRGRNQLLPRYWPRITDQELQQISGDLNSNIVPLFEKVLSASDAGRIGRLVLPKACAEAYFPPISQSEGLPIKIQDVKGKEWTFQFRFWPNNNSRMYVLEGVTPCIQNMQLQAGDTVIFSRIDPGGNLVMGFRKATNPVDMQDGQEINLPNGGLQGDSSFSCVIENLPTKHGGKSNEESLQQPVLIPEKKKTRNIGSKSKRLHMHSEDAMELRITWEEAQDLLRPSPTSKPNIVMIEDAEFEEYEEPPVFGKKTIFTSRGSGEQEQWAQCDSCFKWRRLPVNVLLPPKWTCSDNVWDSDRCSCAAPDEIIPKEMESFFRVSKDYKRRRISENIRLSYEHEPSGLEALATAAVLGDNASESGELSVGATTKHPRHRPGCTCIVCIQPPSGKGKHKPTCMCNVCLTVKRRFKTLMLRKKKRQSEREAEIAQGKDQIFKDEGEMDAASLLQMNYMDNENSPCGTELDMAETGKGRLDLNCHPNRDDDMPVEAAGMSLTNLVNAASLPLDMFLRENGLAALGGSSVSKAAGESGGHPTEEYYPAPPGVEQENQSDCL